MAQRDRMCIPTRAQELVFAPALQRLPGKPFFFDLAAEHTLGLDGEEAFSLLDLDLEAGAGAGVRGSAGGASGRVGKAQPATPTSPAPKPTSFFSSFF